jgi:signal transduction histidine kinase
LLKLIQNLGTANLNSKEKINKLRLLNSAYLIVCIATILDFFVNLVSGYNHLTLLPLSVFLFMVLMLFLNSRGKNELTKVLSILFFDLYLIYQHYLFGQELQMAPVYVLMTIFVITMFEGQRFKMFVLCGLTILSYIISRIITEIFVSPYTSYVLPSMKDIYFLMSISLSIVLVVKILEQRKNYLELTKRLLNDVEKKNLELENQNKELERFAYATSHDLKTPLRNITSFIELIQKKNINQQDPTVNQYLEYTKKGVGQMNKSIDDILTFSGLDFNQESHENVDLNELLENLLFNYSHKIESGILKIDITNLPHLYGNKNQINVIFQNLIDNGLKYNTNKLAYIKISGETVNDEVQINIEDNGIGIDTKYADEIFLPFKRLHGNEKYEGTGLGLAIVQKIMDRHHGRVDLSSSKEGSIFKLIFPNEGNIPFAL